MTSGLGRLGRVTWQLSVLGLALTLTLRLSSLISGLVSNAGWLQLARAQNSPEASETWTQNALDLFLKAAAIDDSNDSALRGAGVVYADAGSELAALRSWQEAQVDPELLIGFGSRAEAENRWDEALLYYKVADALDRDEFTEGQVLAASVCQLFLFQEKVLVERNRAFCQDYFTLNDNNLIVNGQFDRRSMRGWRKRYFSGKVSAVYGIDEAVGAPAPAASIVGLTADYHGGVFQIIALPAGATIRYSAWIKIRSGGSMSARLLYFRGEGVGGSALLTISGDMDWSYLERAFQVPDAHGDLFWFFPVLLTGKGTVWVDGVSLQLMAKSDRQAETLANGQDD